MIKRAFVGIKAPQLKYTIHLGPIADLPVPPNVILLLDGFHDCTCDKDPSVGDFIKTGQRIAYNGSDAYVISSVTGTISAITPYVGTLGKQYTAISINTSEQDEWDDEFTKEATFDTLQSYFKHMPGIAPFDVFADPDKKIMTIIIMGIDQDLLISVNSALVNDETSYLKAGIEILRNVFNIDRLLLIVPKPLIEKANTTGVQVESTDLIYPNHSKKLLVKKHMAQVVAKGFTVEDLGITFFSAEAVAGIGAAFKTGRLPIAKTMTIIDKNGNPKNIRARIGTPVKNILQSYNLQEEDGDRIILGGPMNGRAVYSTEIPIDDNTDGLLILPRDEYPRFSDYPCINCGECVRICPVKIPVNMLVRYLDARQYDYAASLYDLDCCVECGLCAYVCVARIPILQHIQAAKNELELAKSAGE